MKFTKTLLASALFAATSSLAFAAQDSTTIEINVTKDAFVNLIGTAVGSTHDLTTDAIDGTTVNLGTLGTESNTGGDCDISFTTANGFSLNHEISNAPLTTYSLSWNGNTFNTDQTYTNLCDFPATDKELQFTAGALPPTIIAGTYSDVVTVTVVTQ